MTQSYVVRYGQMRFLGEFEGLPDRLHPRGEQVIVHTDRGTELGEVLCASTDRAAMFLENPIRGPIVRVATAEDRAAGDRLTRLQQEGFAACREFIGRRKLQMDLVDVEALLGGERIVFYYLAEKRVDFRDLVKDLARTFHTRIEMRQIGVRDEAKLLADYGDCGKPVCCNTHLAKMPPVSMRMAKLQKTTLDPSKISGRCGRLKCCLRYEFDAYAELERELPSVGSQVTTPKGQGKVIALEILAKKLVVEFEDRRRLLVDLAEVSHTESRKSRPPAPGPTAGPPPFEEEDHRDP